MTDTRNSKPSPGRMRLLKTLAAERGETFAMPTTNAQAAAEIRRLRARPRSSRIDIARERRAVSRDMATARGGAAAPQTHELTGHGSTAAWSSEARPLLTILHSREAGTLVDGTTAGDGAAGVLKDHGLRWSPSIGRWHLPGSARKPDNHRLLAPLAAALRVCGFEVELPDD